MPDKVRTLHEVKPLTLAESIRNQVVSLLEEVLQEAKDGKIEEIAIILKHTSGEPLEWSERASTTTAHTSWIGRLEMLKHDWITHANNIKD